MKVSLTLLLDKYNELKKNYDKKINTFLVNPMSKNIQNSINKDSGKFNNSRLFIEKSSLQLNTNNHGPLIIQSLKKKISLEEFEKMNESLNNLIDQLKDKEKYSKMKDAEIRRLELLVKEYEVMKIAYDDLNKRNLDLKKFNDSIRIEVDFFKEEIERLKNQVDYLLREKYTNQELISNSKKNYEMFVEIQNNFNSLESSFLIKSQEAIELEELLNEKKKIIENLKEENNQINNLNKTLKERIEVLEEELLSEQNKNSFIEKNSKETILEKEERIKSLENNIESYISNEVKYIDMFQQIKEKTKISYENFHKIYLENEKKYEKKIKDLKNKIDNIKMKVIKKINSKFIASNNIIINNPNAIKHNTVSTPKDTSIPVIRKISFQNKFEIIGIPKKINNVNQISISKVIVNNEKYPKKMNDKNMEDLEEQYLDIIENYKKSINDLKNELREKLLKLEKHDAEKNKLIYQIQNYERYMKENERKSSESSEKVNKMELVINQLNSKVDIMTKENAKYQRNLNTILKEDLVKEEILKKDFIQQISDLKNQLQQYKIENQGKSRIIEERNEEIKMLKSQFL